MLDKGPPRPCEHPLLAGPGGAAARAALERAFGETIEFGWIGERVYPELQGPGRLRLDSRSSAPATDGPTRGRPALLFVQSGEVRVVRVVPVEGKWPRGRDPRVEDLLGPGCFVGLPDAGCALGFGPKAEAAGELHVHVNPGRGAEDPSEPALRVRAIAYDDLRSLLGAYPLLRAWFAQLYHLGVTRCDAFRGLLEQNHLLEGMGLPDQNALVHGAAYACTHVPPRPGALPTLYETGDPVHHAAMVVEGEVELRAKGWRQRHKQVIGLDTHAELVFGSLVSRLGSTPVAPADAAPSADARFLVWDRRQLQRVVARSPSGWARLNTYASPLEVYAAGGLARVTVVAADNDVADSGALALGVALALASEEMASDPSATRPVCVIDLAGGVWMGQALGVPRTKDWIPFDEDERVRWWELTPPTAELARHVRLVTPYRLEDVITLIEIVRAWDSVNEVVVHLPSHELLLPGLQLAYRKVVRQNAEIAESVSAERLEPGLLVLDGLRRIPHWVVWLNGNPDGWWKISDEAPERVIRVDRLTKSFVRAVRGRARDFTSGASGTHDVDDDRPGVRPDHQVRIPDDVPAFEQAASGGLVQAVRAGNPAALARSGGSASPVAAACWRISRMIRGTSVGLALGGGGVWGAAHIGVIAAMEAAGVPIDYVAGTSFGSVIGSVYAGGGVGALRKLAQESSIPPRGRLSRWTSRLLPSPLAFVQDQVRALKQPLPSAMFKAQAGAYRAIGRVVEGLIAPNVGSRLPMALAELPLPFVPVASNLSRHQAYTPYWVDLQTAVQVSGSLPPAFPGIVVRGEVMVDGAPLANVPAEAVRGVGADYVIAVNVVGAPKAGAPGPGLLRGAGAGPLLGLVERASQAWIVAWLTLWKGGMDQARYAADAVVDIHIQGIPVPAVWRCEEVAARAEVRATELDFGKTIEAHWRRGGRGPRGVLVLHDELDFRSRTRR